MACTPAPMLYYFMVKCKCGSTDYREEKSGPHIKAVCKMCNSYIKFLPQPVNDDTIMYFGKYKGFKLHQIPVDYFKYMLDSDALKGSLKQYVITLLNNAR